MTTVEASERLLTPLDLAALMRATWTWDDRALRRDLAALLVDLSAAEQAAAWGGAGVRAETLRHRALSFGAEFVAAVLGPKLIAETSNPAFTRYAEFALERATFARAASARLTQVTAQSAEYAAHHLGVKYPSESSWAALVSADGARGLAKAMRAYGFRLSTSHFFATAGLVWQMLRAVEGETPYLKDIENGAISATLAAAEVSGGWDPALVRTKAVPGHSGWHLSGQKHYVPATDHADVIFVVARSLAGPSLFAVERSAPGVVVTPVSAVDQTRPLSLVTLSDTPATLVSREGSGGTLMMRAVDLATTALAAEQVGVIEKAMSMLGTNWDSRDLSEMTLHHVAAVALWQRALDDDVDSGAAAAAHIGCSRAAVRAATIAAEVLGPSAETDALYRRALSGSLLFGGPALSHERLLERLGI
jgi:alkylation response protein AidB-like acyl-CoA dehydrogenase